MRAMRSSEVSRLIEKGFNVQRVSSDGKYAYCLCHFHTESVPSLVVYLRQGTYYCFGCKKYGRIEGVEERVDWGELSEWERKKILEKRGLPKEFVPIREAHERYQQYILSRRYSLEFAEKHGVGACSTGEYSGRVIIPVEGGFVARYAMDGIPFLLSGETRKVLYPKGFKANRSLYFPNEELRKRKEVVLVEGIFDAWRFEQAGINVAATFGSKLHFRQLLKLLKYDEICLAYDADEAGEKAVEEALRMIPFSTVVTRMFLPKGKDPDDLEPERLKELYEERLFLGKFHSTIGEHL